jgi:HSP20 family protein
MANIVRRGRDQGMGIENARGMAWDPFQVMRDMLSWHPFRTLDTMGPRATVPTWTPQFEIKETPEAYIVKADLPGMHQEDIDISMTGNQIVISGHRVEEDRRETDNFYTTERSYGSFMRSFTLPHDIDAEHVEAKLDHGVLQLSIPKREVKSRKIQLEASASGRNGGDEGGGGPKAA